MLCLVSTAHYGITLLLSGQKTLGLTCWYLYEIDTNIACKLTCGKSELACKIIVKFLKYVHHPILYYSTSCYSTGKVIY